MQPSDRDPAAGGPKRPPAAWVHLTGYGLLALAIYFGLRSMRPAEPPPLPTPRSTAAAAVRPAVPVEGAPVQPSRPADPPARIDPPGGSDDRAKLEPELRAALEKHRKALVAACWEPVAGKGAPPGKVMFRFLISADGRELTRGVRRESGPDDPRLIECLSDTQRWPIRVSPPGAQVGVVVETSLP